MCRNFDIVIPGVHSRLPNDILGLLLKQHYPGLIEIGGPVQPASKWEHYTVTPDIIDETGLRLRNRADWVLHELWVSIP